MEIKISKDEARVKSPFEDVKQNAVRTRQKDLKINSNKRIDVKVDSWQICEEGNEYFVNSAGCGAVKIFVEGDKAKFSLIFHCYGTQNSRYAAKQIADYILSKERGSAKVDILNVQPFSISKDVADCLSGIAKDLTQSSNIQVNQRILCLNNLKGQKNASFINICLDGSKEDILKRYDRFVLKDKQLSVEDRKKKVELFQRIPIQFRTDEFIKSWSLLDLKEAESKVEEVCRIMHPFKAFLRDLKKSFDSFFKILYGI